MKRNNNFKTSCNLYCIVNYNAPTKQKYTGYATNLMYYMDE